MDYGFIITRYVNSEQTNKYWNQCVKLIKRFYPLVPIVIIDDNSDQNLIKSDMEYTDITIINSEFPKRGELLPYYYLLKYKWFSAAVIIHDSLFIHNFIDFNRIKFPVLPLWHHKYDKDNIHNIIRLVSSLSNSNKLKYKIINENTNYILNYSNNNKANFDLCFGCQCYIKLNFLEKLETKYNITRLVKIVKNRTDRCSLERVLGLLFNEECPSLLKQHSLFGDIMLHPRSFHYTFNDYICDLKKNRLISYYVKVWSGR